MGKLNIESYVCILFISGCSQKIAAQHGKELHAENIAEQDKDNNNFDHPNTPVSQYSWNWSF